MNDKQIIREAAATIRERPLTDEEGIAASQAIFHQAQLTNGVLVDLLRAITSEVEAGWQPPVAIAVAVGKASIFLLTGEVLEIPT